MAIEIKRHLKNLYRANPEAFSRRGFLRLDMNESVTGLPRDFVRRSFGRVDPQFLAAYPEYTCLQRKIALHNKLRPENIILANGSDAAIKYIFDAFISRGDKILLTEPTFAMYPVYCKMFAAKAITVKYNSDLSFPGREFLNRIKPGLKMAAVVNPNNPTGSTIEPSVLSAILKRTAANDVLLVVDEAYFYFYPFSVIQQVKKYKNLIVLRTFSKLCGMASLRLGYAASCAQVIESLRKVRPTYDANGLVVYLAEELLDNPGVIQKLVKSANAGKKYLAQRLSGAGIEHIEGRANFILIKCRGEAERTVRQLKEKNILVAGGFKLAFLKDYIRVSVGDRVIMEKFCEIFFKIRKV